MLTEELLDLVRQTARQRAETQTLEVKAAHVGCPQRLYDSLSAFSNQDSGGILLFGVDESKGFEIVGVYDLQDLQKKVTEQCNQMEPPVRAVFTVAEVEGLPICSAEIPAIDLTERPCYYRGAGRVKGSFIRVGDADLPMTDYELYSYEAFCRHLHDDERPVERADLDTLNQDALQRYLLDRRIERPGFGKMSEEQQYEMLNITRNGVPTLAAMLNFGLYPQGYLPQLAITAIVVPGKEIGELAETDSARFLDNKRIEGTIAEMEEEALSFCKRNMKTRTVIDPQTGKRTDQPEYPIRALREAILNALIHRDYSIYTEGTPVQINFFSDRLEIHPDLRNPALAVMAEILTDAENRYSGIPTIRREMAAYGLPAPVFENRRNEFVVTLYNHAQEEGQAASTEEQSVAGHDLLSFCSVPRSRREIAQFLGIKTTYYVTRNYIRPLVEAGKLKMTIPDCPGSPKQKYYAG